VKHSDFDSAVAALRSGQVIAYPTETFFGLGADPFSKKAVDKLLEIKGRDLSAGIPLIIDSKHTLLGVLLQNSVECQEKLQRLLDRFWPGPLTIVFNPVEDFRCSLAAGILAADQTLAVRQSGCELARNLAKEIGGFITSTSANPKSLPPPTSAEMVSSYFSQMLVLDRCSTEQSAQQSLPSTILKVSSEPFEIIREGAISSIELNSFL